MKIKKIIIQAFRCFVDADIDFSRNGVCANFVALQAPNGFGKTSLLDAIEFGMTNRIERFEKANYKDDNVVDKKLRSKHSFLHNKESLKLPIKIKIYLENGQPIDKQFDEKTANLFGRNKKIENEYFRSVILSQDWFSEFISATDPEQRYETFLKYFYEGEDLVQYRILMKQKWNGLDGKKKDIEKQIESLDEILSKPIDGNVRQGYEEQLLKLSEKGIKIPNLAKYDKEELNNCMVVLQSKKEEVAKEYEHSCELSNRLNTVLYEQTEYLSLADMESLMEQISSKRKELNIKQALLEKQKILGQLKHDLFSFEKLREPLLDEKEKLSLGIDTIKDLLTLARQIVDNTNKQEQYRLTVKDINQTISSLDDKIEKLTESSNVSQKKYELMTNRVNNLNEDYMQYHRALKDIEILQKKSDKALENLDGFKKSKETLDSQYQLLQKMKSDVYLFVVSTDGNVIEKYKNEIELLKEKHDSQVEIEKKIQKIEAIVKGQYAYKDEIQKLIIDAQNIQSVLKDGICPVCGFDYKSSKALYERIASNMVLDESIKLQLEQKQQLENYKIQLAESVKTLQETLVDELQTDIEACRNKIEEIKQNIISEMNLIKDTHSIIEEKTKSIEKRKDDFDSLELEQVRKLFLEQQKKLLTISQKCKEDIENILKNKKQLELSASDAEKQIEQLKEEYLKLLSTPFYLALSDKMKSELLKDGFSCDVWNLRLKEVIKKIATYDAQIVQKKDEISKYEQNGIACEDYDSTKVGVGQIQTEIFNKQNILHKTLSYWKYQCLVENIDVEDIQQYKHFEQLKNIADKALKANDESCKKYECVLKDISLLETLVNNLWHFMEYDESMNKKALWVKNIKELENEMSLIDGEIKSLEDYVDRYVANFFDLNLINRLYKMIDPHPKYKHIRFSCDFSNIRPKLSVVVEQGSDKIVPNLYFSTAQVNILSFCIFLAKALNVKDKDQNAVDCIFIDDPIQSLDDINILSLIDLLRNIAFHNNKQIVLTTHDKNFYELLKRKIPGNLFNSKFLRFYERGKVTVDESF